ncbi:MAG: ferritin-like fold-containing protein, partial [Actinomycetota bacterium]
ARDLTAASPGAGPRKGGSTVSETSDEVELATVELLGALAYGQLRSFAAAARLIELAPDARVADVVAEVARHEHEAYIRLRGHLSERTQLPTAVMDRQKASFDAYFDHAPLDDWFGASVFFALGLPIAADFARAIAPALDPATARVVTESLAGRAAFERAAIEQLAVQLVGEDARVRARSLTADLLGRALTSYQGVAGDTDALRVLLASHAGATATTAEQQVKRLALEILSGHRRRSVALGLENLDDVR